MKQLYCNSKTDVRALLESSFGDDGLLLPFAALGAKFFDLSSGVAGELFQTFANYRKNLAIVVPDSSAYSRNFQQLVLEHQSHNSTRFFVDDEQAEQWLLSIKQG